MSKYIVLECMECKHKDIYVNGTSDGKRCEKCGSGCYFPIDGGSKSELMARHKCNSLTISVVIPEDIIKLWSIKDVKKYSYKIIDNALDDALNRYPRSK